ncbi:MAG: glycoside hydrolase family 31 protein [bacterium]
MNRRFRTIALAAVLILTASIAQAASIGNVTDWRAAGNKAVFQCEGANIEMSFLEGNILRIEASGQGIAAGAQSPLTLEKSPVLLDARQDRAAGTVIAGEMTVRISEKPFAFELIKGDKTLLHLVPDGIEWREDGSYTLSFMREKGDSFLGLGEQLPDPIGAPIKMDYKGGERKIWNRHVPPADLGIPLFYNPVGYGLFIDNPWKADFTFGKKIVYSAAGGPIRFYIFDAPDAFKMLDSYTNITGKAPIPPRWATGYMQSRFGYHNETDYRWLITNFRERNIPCDTLIFDLDWFGTMGNLSWYLVNFPDPKKLMKEIKNAGFKTIVITEPYVFTTSKNFQDAFNKKLFAKDAEGKDYIFPFWGAKAALLDFTNGDTQKWFADKIKAIHLTGVDGWWTDLNEPENEYDGMKYNIGKLEAGHNLQGFLMNKTIHDLYEKDFPNERCLMMSRSGFAGSQRWGTSVWSGDVVASWAHLRAQIPIALNTGLSGLALWNSDTGGFHNQPSPELYTRWIQFSSFSPIFRSHGTHTVREPWSFGEEAEKICKKYINFRMRLAPYLYSLFYEMHKSGAPIMRPTFMEAPGEDISLNGQFFYGHELLIAPVTDEGAKKKPVTLPAGRWTYLWDERIIEGPKRISVPVDLNTMPIFVREGAIIPMGPVMQYTGEKKTDPLTIHYYPASTPSSYNLYEDDGITNDYDKNEFAITRFEAESKGNSVSVGVGKPKGSYKGMPSVRSYEIVVHHAPGDGTVTLKGIEAKPISKYSATDKTFTVSIPPSSGEFSVDIKYK